MVTKCNFISTFFYAWCPECPNNFLLPKFTNVHSFTTTLPTTPPKTSGIPLPRPPNHLRMALWSPTSSPKTKNKPPKKAPKNEFKMAQASTKYIEVSSLWEREVDAPCLQELCQTSIFLEYIIRFSI